MPKCSKCGPKAEADFSRKGDGFQPYCKSCQKRYKDKHYRTNRRDYVEKVQSRRKRLSNLVTSLKEGKLCMDCGVGYPPYVMDFDHRPGTEKVVNVSQVNKRGSRRQVFAEIAKCDLVCSNCHRMRTFKRLKLKWKSARLLSETVPGSNPGRRT